jgi:hypothetical protein
MHWDWTRHDWSVHATCASRADAMELLWRRDPRCHCSTRRKPDGLAGVNEPLYEKVYTPMPDNYEHDPHWAIVAVNVPAGPKDRRAWAAAMRADLEHRERLAKALGSAL